MRVIDPLTDGFEDNLPRGSNDITGHTTELDVGSLQYFLDAIHYLGTLADQSTAITY